MPFVIPDRIERLFPPMSLTGVTEGDWIEISTVFDARVQRVASQRGAIYSSPTEYRWDGFSFRQAILELVIKAWSDPSIVTPEAISAMTPDVQDWIYAEFNRLNGRRDEEEKKDSITDSSEDSSIRESSPENSLT